MRCRGCTNKGKAIGSLCNVSNCIHQGENWCIHAPLTCNLKHSLAPPAYAECVLGSARIWDENDAASGAVLGDTSFTPMYAFVSNYEFRPATAGAFTEEEITVEREPRLDAVDDGLSDSMDEQSD